MAYNTPYTFIALQTLLASQLNGIQDNIATLWPYSAAGDIGYTTSASVLARLAKGTANQVLKMKSDASIPEWGAGGGISNRQGGSATDWSTPGTTNYTPTASKIQCGEASVVISGGLQGITAVTFPVAFANDSPLVSATITKFASGSLSGNITSVLCLLLSKTGMSIYVNLSAVSTVTLNVFWMAIGE